MTGMKVDPRFLNTDGPEIFTGNELLLKGALEVEGGVHLLAGYPGSPVAGFFDSMSLIKDLLNDAGIRAAINNNEALAAASLNGSQVAGCRGMIVMKSVGVHVAADALALGSLSGAHPDGGAVVVYGDDPWSDSTQAPSDSRYISKHLFIPVIEPSDPQELKDWVDLAFKISRRSELYCGYICPTNLADGGGTVHCRENQYPQRNTKQPFEMITREIDQDKFVLLPPRTWWQEEAYAPRMHRACEIARELGVNRIEYPNTGSARKPIGLVTSGMAYGYLKQALWEMGLLGELPILKFGMSYPMDPEMIRRLGEQCERVVVVEERRGFLEEQIAEVVMHFRQKDQAFDLEVWGKTFPDDLPAIPHIRGLHPSTIMASLGPLVRKYYGPGALVNVPAMEAIEKEIETIDTTGQTDVGQLPARVASFCAGCPHRDSASVCLEIKRRFANPEYMNKKHNRGPVDLLFHGDIGCYTMLMFPPNDQLMHNLSGMGLGGGTGSGMDPFVSNKQAVFMGDSTFFHSGMLAISQAIKLGQDITFIILDNSTTAMTGHQTTPELAYDVLNNETDTQDIESVVRGLGTENELEIARMDPSDRDHYEPLLEEMFLADGVKVVIADKECAITENRRIRRAERLIRKKLGYLPVKEHMNVNIDACKFCLRCSEMTGCPALKHVETDYGLKMDTDLTTCVADGSCEKIGQCSSFERVIVKRKRKPRTRIPELGLDDIPEPPKTDISDVWRAVVVGVGGMGIGLATQIILRAGHKEGYKVHFLDKKGLAVRNGGGMSQIVYNVTDEPITAVVPYGKADLLLGVDVLEAARALDPRGRGRVASKERTAAVINTYKAQTIGGVMGREDFNPAELEERIRRHTRDDDFLARDISTICEKYLGSKLYANIMMIGFAFQKGLLPVSMHSIAWAIKDTIRADFRKNIFAFNMGRKLCQRMDIFQGAPRRTGWKQTLDEKSRHIHRRRGAKAAQQLRTLVSGACVSAANLDESLKRDLVIRAYDCMRWGGASYAQTYIDKILALYAKDRTEFGYAATRAAIHQLASSMLIRDGIFLAELITSPEKYARDREKYNVNPANGDKLRYRHQWSWELKLFGWRKRITHTMVPWMLRIIKRMRWARKLLPAWHRREKQYRDRYMQALDTFEYGSYDEYVRKANRLSSSRCLSCTEPICAEAGCPLESRVPEWVDLADQHKWREACDVLHSRNNFPEFTAQICPAPCQDACKRSLQGYSVQIRDIEQQIIDRAFDEGWISPQPPVTETGKRIAIVGSGPAGLAAAQQLARNGHEVHVYEREDRIGGLLRYGIPEPRLAKKLIDRRIEQLKAEGVNFHTGVEVGRNLSAQSLRDDHDAILLAVGAPQPRDLDVPGRSRNGVHFAMDFLRQQNAPSQSDYLEEQIAVDGKTVTVIGGGLTGEDCVEAALRQGAREVHQLEILPKRSTGGGTPTDEELAEDLDGVNRQWCVATKGFDGSGDQLAGVQAVRVQWVPSPKGPVMKEVNGSEFQMDTDLAVLALGFEAVPDESLVTQLGLETNAAGKLIVRSHRTSDPAVFAAGDVVTGAAYVVTAIDSGRKAADRIEEALAVTPSEPAAARAARPEPLPAE